MSNPADIEKLEEEKLKAKYSIGSGVGPGARPGGHSAFLQKRLQKGVSCVDIIIVQSFEKFVSVLFQIHLIIQVESLN